ncbi:translation initiation factor eIF-2B [Chloroflexota bacterium]
MNINPEISTVIHEIKNDKTHGASQLARQAIDVFKTATKHSQTKDTGEFLLELQKLGQDLISTRPTMAPIFNIINRLLNSIEPAKEMNLDSAKQFTTLKINESINNSLDTIKQITQYCLTLINSGDKIMTHSYSSTVISVLKEASIKYKDIEVIITRSGPGNTGKGIIEELTHYGIPTTFIDDTAAGLYLSTTSKVMLGADRICADNKVINGIGTYHMALISKEAGVPFYVLCDTLKFDPRLNSPEVDLEDKDPSEIIESDKVSTSIKVKNPHFDITPMELITAIVTEKGLITGEDLTSIWEDS